MATPYRLVIDLYVDIMHRRAAKALSNIDAFLKQTYYQGRTYKLDKEHEVKKLRTLLAEDRKQLLPLVHDLKADKERAIKRSSANYVNAMSGYEVNNG